MIAGVSPTAIAVQSPCVAQVQLLRKKLEEYQSFLLLRFQSQITFRGERGRGSDHINGKHIRMSALFLIPILNHTSKNVIRSGCADAYDESFRFSVSNTLKLQRTSTDLYVSLYQ